MNRKPSVEMWVLSVGLVAGCAGDSEPEPGLVAWTGAADAPISYRIGALSGQSGLRMQSAELQGQQLQGQQLQGQQLQGMQLQGQQLQGMQLQGATLTGRLTTATGTRQISGAGLIGATLVGRTTGGAAVQLRITNVEADATDSLRELKLYTVEYLDTSAAVWRNVCQTDSDGVAKAIPTSGFWDAQGGWHASSDTFTFGCTMGVIAKCLRWGYRPFHDPVGISTNRNLHQTCTRMARADYCGTGVSHTRNGTWIDLYDVYGISVPVQGDGMSFEATWGPLGATCFLRPRWRDLPPDCGQNRASQMDVAMNQPDPCPSRLIGQDPLLTVFKNRSYNQ